MWNSMYKDRFEKLKFNAEDLPVANFIPFDGIERLAFLEFLSSNLRMLELKSSGDLSAAKIIKVGIQEYANLDSMSRRNFGITAQKFLDYACAQTYKGNYEKAKEVLNEELIEGSTGKYPVINPLNAEMLKIQIAYLDLRLKQTAFNGNSQNQ